MKKIIIIAISALISPALISCSSRISAETSGTEQTAPGNPDDGQEETGKTYPEGVSVTAFTDDLGDGEKCSGFIATADFALNKNLRFNIGYGGGYRHTPTEFYKEFSPSKGKPCLVINGGYFSGSASVSLAISGGNFRCHNIMKMNWPNDEDARCTVYPVRSAFGQMPGFGFRNQAALRELLPVFAESRTASAPQKDLQITQSSGAFLDVWLKRIGRFVIALMALAHFEHFASEKYALVERLAVARVGLFKQALVAEQKARLHEGRGNGDVLFASGDHLVACAHGAADRQSQLPEIRDEGFNRGFELVVVAAHEHQDVDVRVGKHLRAPVAAYGRHGKLKFVKAAGVRRLEHEAVDGSRISLEIFADAADA